MECELEKMPWSIFGGGVIKEELQEIDSLLFLNFQKVNLLIEPVFVILKS
jgi:hypothetical protein